MGSEHPKSALEAAQITRRYVHFDTPLSRADCKKLVADPMAIKSHSFYPFMRHDVIRAKLKRTSIGIKKSLKIRDIRYASHADAAIYAYYNFLLMDRYEKRLTALGLSDNVIAFRTLGKSNVDFAQEAFEWIDSHRPCLALGFDVKDFFGSLDHQLLKESWASLLDVAHLPDDHYSVFKSLSKHASVELIAARKALGLSRESLNRLTRLCTPAEFRKTIRGGNLVFVNNKAAGIPQGSPVSAALSNIYMLPFDAKIKAAVEGMGGFYRRYCDDILVVVPEMDAASICKLVQSELTSLRLSMQPSKTLVCHFGPSKSDVPLQYLGLIYDGTKVVLRASGVTRFYLKMRRGVTQFKDAKKKDGDTALLIQRRRTLIQRYTEHTSKESRSYFKYVKMATRKTKSAAIKKQLTRHRMRLKLIIER